LNTSSGENFLNFTNALTGFLVALAFWISNSTVRKRWYNLIKYRKFDIDNDSIIITVDGLTRGNVDELTRNSVDDYGSSMSVSLIDRNSRSSSISNRTISINNSNGILSNDSSYTLRITEAYNNTNSNGIRSNDSAHRITETYNNTNINGTLSNDSSHRITEAL